MAQASRTFRIFVSSTFSDLKAERNALQEKVFPRLRDLAAAHGCRFQAIDLRWGVSEEAALDQQTMKICLGEIERCQKTSPRPNFIVLLGDRYGWCPIPSEIPADEFEQIIPLVMKEEKNLLQHWYSRDDNAVPPVYLLQPRTGEFVEHEHWEQVEAKLRQTFQFAIKKISLSPDAVLKYTASATEQELVAGALNVSDANEHVFCFLRDIKGMPNDGSAASFRETEPEAAQKQEELKERLRRQLSGNVHEYTAKWQGDGPSQEHLDPLCEDVYAELSKVILAETRKLEKVDPLEAEITVNKTFGKERARVFIGRADILSAIEKYVSGSDPHPLAIWGASGSGKSALMAKAIEQTQKSSHDVIYRFIGATPESSNGRALLESLCKQISRRYGADESTIPSEYKDLVQEFPKRLALAKLDKPLVIFLDALDQLSDTDNARSLIWLPAELPPNVRLIVSTLPGECFTSLESKAPAQNRLEVQPMTVEDGKAILGEWFKEIGRTLQKSQQQYLLDKFQKCALPLYLKLAFEEAKLWKSYSPPAGLSEDIPGILRDLFKRLSQESNHGERLVSRSLGYLAAAKNGLSEDELLDVLSLDNEVLGDFQRRSPKSPKSDRLPVVLWSRLYFDLEPYLTERSADGTSLLAFYHTRSFTNVIAENYLSGKEKSKRHFNLANYFGSKKRSFWINRETRLPDRRKVSELVYQQAKAGLNVELKETLITFEFLFARIVASSPEDLITDYDLMLENLGESQGDEVEGIRCIRDSLRLSAHMLKEDADQLSSQLFGRLVDFSNSQVQLLLRQAEQWTKGPWLRPMNSCMSLPGGALTMTLTGHTAEVEVVAISQDGRLALSGSEDETIKVWDLDKGIEKFTLHGHTAPIASLAISFDKRWAVSGSEDNTLRVWDLDQAKEKICLQLDHRVAAVAIAPDAHRIACATMAEDRLGFKGLITVWDLESGDRVTVMGPPEINLKPFDNIPRYSFLRNITSIVFSQDGHYILLGYGFGQITLVDLEMGTKKFIFDGDHEAPPNYMAMSENMEWAISCHPAYGQQEGDELRVWNLKEQNKRCSLNVPKGGITSVAISPDGHWGLSSSRENTITLWDLEQKREKFTLQGHQGRVLDISVSSDWQRVVSGSGDKTLKVWNLKKGEEENDLFHIHQEVRSIKVSPDDRFAVSDYTFSNFAQVWDMRDWSEKFHIYEPNNILSLIISPDGRSLISCCEAKEGYHIYTNSIWDLETGERKLTLRGGPKLAISPNGKWLTTAEGNCIIVWGLERGNEQYRLYHNGFINYVTISPDGYFLVSCCDDKILEVWDLATGKEKITLRGHKGSVDSVLISPDGRSAVSSSEDEFKVWDLAKGEEKFSFRNTSPIKLMTISPDGRWVISNGMGHRDTRTPDLDIKVWDLETGQEKYTLRGHSKDINRIEISPDGQWLFSSSSDMTIKMWNINDGQCVTTFRSEGGFTSNLSIRGEPTRILIGNRIGQIFLLGVENLPNSARIETAWRCSIEGQQTTIAFGCPYCRTWSEISESVLGSKISCPNCSKPIKVNPFTIEGDWHHIAEAWNQGENKIYSDLDNKEILQEALGQQMNILDTRKYYDGVSISQAQLEQIGRELSNLWATKTYDSALKLGKELELISLETGNKFYLQIALGCQADVLNAIGKKDEALALYKEREQICRDLKNKEMLQSSLEQQAAILYDDKKDYDTALSLWKEQENICRELGNKEGLQRSLGNQALILSERGDLDGAMALYKEQVQICSDMGNSEGMAIAMNKQLEIAKKGKLRGIIKWLAGK